MKPIQISVLPLREFEQILRREPDVLARRPFVVEGFVERWPAYRTWQDYAVLDRKFGHLAITAGAPQFVTHKAAASCAVGCTYSEYLDYLRSPSEAEAIFAGKWIKGSLPEVQALGMPLYCGNVRFVAKASDPLFQEISPLTPGLECWNAEIPQYYQIRNHVWLYVGLKGALTPLHADNNGVIAYLAQLKGSKRATLFSPEDRAHYHRPGLGYMDVLKPNTKEFPTWAEATPWVADLNSGQALIWGPNWAHHVSTLSDSVTVSLDIVNGTNLEEYTQSQDWAQVFGGLARQRRQAIEAAVPDAFSGLVGDESDQQIGRSVMIQLLRAALVADLPAKSRLVKQQMLSYLEAKHRDMDHGRRHMAPSASAAS